jgi:hypothetical protein
VWQAHLSTHPGLTSAHLVLTLCLSALRVSARKSGVGGGEWKVSSMQISVVLFRQDLTRCWMGKTTMGFFKFRSYAAHRR